MTAARLARWWENSTPARGRQGDITSPAGRTGRILCPKCKNYPVVYNGNYFCDDYHAPALSPDGQGGSCDWALAHPAESKRDRAICDLIGIDYD